MIHQQDSQELELFETLAESATTICHTVQEYSMVANILSSDITDIKKYQNIHLKAFLANHMGDDHQFQGEISGEEEEESDDVIEMNPKLFKKIVRRRSVIENTNQNMQQRVFRKNSVTAALERITPSTISSTGWDFTHLLALSTTTRFSLSKGLLKHLLSCLTSFHRSYQPIPISLLSQSPSISAAVSNSMESTYQLIKPLYEYIRSIPIHPAAIPIIQSLQLLYSLIISNQPNHFESTTQYHGKQGLSLLIDSLQILMTKIRQFATDSSQCLSLVTKINSILEDIICKYEGTHRANILTKTYASILINSFLIEMPALPDVDITSAQEYLSMKFPHPLSPKRLLSPICDSKWVEYLLSQEHSVIMILNQRRISSESDQVAADIARFTFLPLISTINSSLTLSCWVVVNMIFNKEEEFL